MWGRFKRKSDKKKIVKAFEVTAGTKEADFAPGDDLRSQSLQPLIYLDADGERRIEMMRWGFKLPDRLLFNARSEGIAQANFWKDAFLTGRAIAPSDGIFEWKKMPEGKKSPSTKSPYRGRNPSVWRWSGSSGRIRRPASANAPLPSRPEIRTNWLHPFTTV